jgi:hypothetical protein
MASFFLPLHIPSFPLNILLLNQHPPNQWTLFLHLGYKVIKLFITGMIITHSFQPVAESGGQQWETVKEQ